MLNRAIDNAHPSLTKSFGNCESVDHRQLCFCVRKRMCTAGQLEVRNRPLVQLKQLTDMLVRLKSVRIAVLLQHPRHLLQQFGIVCARVPQEFGLLAFRKLTRLQKQIG